MIKWIKRLFNRNQPEPPVKKQMYATFYIGEVLYTLPVLTIDFGKNFCTITENDGRIHYVDLNEVVLYFEGVSL